MESPSNLASDQLASADISIDAPEIPGGEGSIRGLKSALSQDAFSGRLQFSLPIETPKARNLNLALGLVYDSAAGNGVFGLGFNLETPAITLRPQRVPRYDGHDQYVFSDGGRLVPAGEGLPGPTGPSGRPESDAYEIQEFLPIQQRAFSRIERWVRRSDGDVHWRVTDTANAVSIFGASNQARISDPSDAKRVYTWLLESRSDGFGNKVRFDYLAEDGARIPSQPAYAGRDHSAQRYPGTVRFGNYFDAEGVEQWAFQVCFDYGQYDLSPANPEPTVPVQEWPVRPDPFSSYRSGFEVRTWRRCENIFVTHCFPADLGDAPLITRILGLSYDPDYCLSRLRSVQETGWRISAQGEVETLRPPALDLTWTARADTSAGFSPVQFDAGSRFGPQIANTPPRLVDLDGDALPGLLVSAPSALLYWQNQGEGRFSPPASPRQMPVDRDLAAAKARLTPVDRFGRLDMMVQAPDRSGYYGNLGDDGWAPFKPFASAALEAFAPNVSRVDLSGAGSSDLLALANDELTWAMWAYAEGYSQTFKRSNIPPIPNPTAPNAVNVVRFANVFGDGMAHLTQLSSGQVRIWPNLGYGNFADPVVIENAPLLPPEISPERIFLTDTDGTGTVDLVLVLDQYLEIYPNHSGNAFAAPTRVALPAPWETIDSITFGDILASGTNAAIVSLTQGVPRHFYHDFNGGVKANLIESVANGRGGITRVSWRASTWYQLQDARQGRPWITTAPFPVQVVAKLTTVDQIAESVLTKRFAYHNAYYDPVLFAFRGFSEVESWDTEEFEDADHNVFMEEAQYAPTAYAKSWFINGAYEAQPALQAEWRAQFFTGDGTQIDLPFATFDLGDFSADGRSQRQAWSGLAGSPVRTEVYGLDQSDQAGVPYEVRQTSSTATLLQQPTASVLGVFFAAEDQHATVVYEREPADPRTSHELTLSRNGIGLPLLTADVAYPRQADAGTVLPQQDDLYVTAAGTTYAAPQDGSYVLDAKATGVEFVCDGLTPDDGLYFSAAGLAAQIETALADPLLPEQPFTGTSPQARWAAANHVRYLDASTGDPLQLGEVVSPRLTWRNETAAFTPGMLKRDFGDRLDDVNIGVDGGYRPDGDFWWAPSSTAHYAAADQFYLITGETDAFGATTTSAYDPYSLAIVEIVDAKGQASHFSQDYQALAPARVTDINGIVAQALYDPMGEVLAQSSFGEVYGVRQGDGDLADYKVVVPVSIWDVIENPQTYLQDATSYNYRDLDPWDGDLSNPPANVAVSRQFYLSNSEPQAPLAVIVTYYDGSGRELQAKALVDGAGVGRPDDSWVSSGRSLYNNKGNVVRAYVPTIQDTAKFKRQPEGPFETSFYDALGRRIQILTAKGFLEEKHYGAWSQVVSDRDDTVTRSPYYIAHIHDSDPAFRLEREALESAAALADTPTTTHVDPRDLTIRIDQLLKTKDDPLPQTLSTVHILDRQGRTVAISDPRFTAANEAGEDPVYNLRSFYDMRETVLLSESCDAGTTRSLNAVDEQVIDRWTANDTRCETRYDALRRRTSIWLTLPGESAREIEKFTYGSNPQKNLNGRLTEHRDEAGLIAFDVYDIIGNATSASRRVLENYTEPVDWASEPPPALDDPVTITSDFTISGQVLHETGPDGLRIDYSYYRPEWLAGQALSLDGEAEPVGAVSDLVYNARGDRTSASFANGVVNTRSYEETTGRLLTIKTTRLSDGKALQEISYTYDPIGNLTSVVDNSVNGIVTGHELVDPDSAYAYDSLYRLINGAGRQAKGIGPDTYHNGFMGTAFIQAPDPNDTSKLVRYQEAYDYDQSGNPLSLVHTTSHGSGNFTRIYAVSETSNHSVPDSMIAGGKTPDDFYDPAGNMIGLPVVPTLQWSWRSTLDKAVVIDRSGDGQIDDAEYYLYAYNTLRVLSVSERLINGGSAVDLTKTVTFGKFRVRTRQQTTPGRRSLAKSVTTQQVTVRVLNGDRLNLIAHFWDGGSGSDREIRYQYPTDLGSVALELDHAAALLSYEEYFPYGGSSFIAGPGKTEVAEKTYRYAGKERDNATGLYCYGARYYASWLCRWISPDPAGIEDGLNLYAYVQDNPISRGDQTGLCGTPSDEQHKQMPPPQSTVPIWDATKAGATGMFGAYGAHSMLMGGMDLTGVKPLVHASSSENVLSIIKSGLTANQGGGVTPKGFPAVYERSIGYSFFTDLSKFGSSGTHSYYSYQSYLKDIPSPKINAKGFLQPMPNWGVVPYMMPYNISPKNTAMALAPYNVWKGMITDPDSVLKGMTGKFGPFDFSLPRGVHSWEVGGSKGVIEVEAGFIGRGAVKILGDVSPEFFVGPKFSPMSVLVGVVTSFPSYVKQNPGQFAKGALRSGLGGAFVVVAFEELTKDEGDSEKGLSRITRIF